MQQEGPKTLIGTDQAPLPCEKYDDTKKALIC
jgi:hypothetical protein